MVSQLQPINFLEGLMKISLKDLFFGIIFSTAVFMGTSLAQTTLPVVTVTGTRSTSWSCTGQCVDMFFAQYTYKDSNILYESEAPLSDDSGEPVLETAERIPSVLQCAGAQHTRDTQAWLAYKAFALAKAKGNGLAAISWDSNQTHGFFSFLFSDGSVGLYQRTDSGFLDSDGMVEINKPACGS